MKRISVLATMLSHYSESKDHDTVPVCGFETSQLMISVVDINTVNTTDKKINKKLELVLEA